VAEKKLVFKNGRMFLLDMDAPPLPANRYFSANQGITPLQKKWKSQK
jgi:hypothetical protein